MLIEFTTKNFRSFRDETKLSMIATADKDNLDNIISMDKNKLKLLKSAVVYGSNGSGKSNLIKALNAMQSIVLSSSKEQRGDEIKDIDFFAFDIKDKKLPTLFEVIFIVDNIRYQYGFSATKTKIYEEWLYSFPKAAKRTWFTRFLNEESDSYEWEYTDGKYLNANKDKMKLYIETTRDNELFLSKIIQLNNKEAIPVFDWFKTELKCAGIEGWNDGESVTLDFLKSEDKKNLILGLMNDMGIQVNDIKTKEEKFDISKLNLEDEMPDELKQKIVHDLSDRSFVETKFLRKLKDEKMVALNLAEESDGTQKIFSLLGPFLDALEKGYVVVMDELHNSLHPLLLKYLVSLFHNKDINTKNAQLIFTTHETEILNQDIFRRDQIWFCDKDATFASELIPLTDYKPRKSEKLSKGYLIGRYGGIPILEEDIKFSIKKIMGL
jgi:hypothetical protein